MNRITEEAIKQLLTERDEPRLSIYMPTHRVSTPPNMQEDKIRYKNLIRKGRDMLSEENDAPGASKIFDQLEAKVSNDTFWQHLSEGLAIFVSPSECHMFHLPIECEEHIYVNRSYDVAPLLAMQAFNQEYFVLALAMQNPKLYKGDMYGLEAVEIELPKDMESALNIDEMHAGSRTVKSREAPRGPGDSISPHGEGDSHEAGHEERLKYLRIIDQKICSLDDASEKTPLLLAGTENEVGDFKSITRYPEVMENYLHGNHTVEHPHDLHADAWQVVRSEIGEAKKQERLEKFSESKGVYKASTNVDEITKAAGIGRVESLIINLINYTRDTISDSNSLPIPKIVFGDKYEKRQIGELAMSVHDHGGEIFAVDGDSMPGSASVAAIYRYAS